MTEPKPTKAKLPMGRPKGSGVNVWYQPDVVEEIIERVSAGETLARVVRVTRDGQARAYRSFPSYSTIDDWADPKFEGHHPDFVTKFARARLAQQRLWLDEIKDIADEPELTYEQTIQESEKFGRSTKQVRKDNIARSNLRIQTRLDAIARMNPQMWAERLQQVTTRPEDAPGGARLVIEGGLPENEPPVDLPPEEDAPPPPEGPEGS